MRRTELFCDGWLLSRKNAPSDLPCATEASSDAVSYERSFSLEESERGKRILLDFHACPSLFSVYLNGCHVRGTRLDADVTDLVRFGEENTLTVCAKEACGADELCRGIRLVSTDAIAVGGSGVTAIPRREEGDAWCLDLTLPLVSISDSQETVEIVCAVVDAEGEVVASTEYSLSVPAHSRTDAVCALSIDSPRLWRIESPYLYEVKTRILRGGAICDSFDTYTAFRPLPSLQGEAGAPARLVLRTDCRCESAGSIAFVTCYLTDREGRFVENTSLPVSVGINPLGRILSTVPPSDTADSRVYGMQNGALSLAVGISLDPVEHADESGTLLLTASAEGLESATLKIEL